ncbi:MAG: polysulfide reductase NrfD [Dehalococcoidales bacterium]|nr:polysulfide reductase NrfD [Dehalococcoidales bacterium]
MKKEMTWSWPIASYLFLGGLGGGIAIISAVADIFLDMGDVFLLGPCIAAILIGLGSVMLIFELGKPSRFWRVIITRKIAEMTVGAWMLTLLMLSGFVYSSFWLELLPWYGMEVPRLIFSWICLILGVGVSLYTGVFLGTMKSRPFWNSPALPVLFLIISLSTGMAAQILIINSWSISGIADQITEATTILNIANIVLLVFEVIILLVYVLMMKTSATIYSSQLAASWLTGSKSFPFWIGVITSGIILPIVLYSTQNIATTIVAALFVLIGGVILRFLVVYTEGRIMLPGEEEFLYWLPNGDEEFISKWEN